MEFSIGLPGRLSLLLGLRWAKLEVGSGAQELPEPKHVISDLEHPAAGYV